VLPRFDGTGPRGEGPMTGWGNGYCALPLNEKRANDSGDGASKLPPNEVPGDFVRGVLRRGRRLGLGYRRRLGFGGGYRFSRRSQ